MAALRGLMVVVRFGLALSAGEAGVAGEGGGGAREGVVMGVRSNVGAGDSRLVDNVLRVVMLQAGQAVALLLVVVGGEKRVTLRRVDWRIDCIPVGV